MSQVSCEQEKTLAVLQQFDTASFLTPLSRPPALPPASRGANSLDMLDSNLSSFQTKTGGCRLLLLWASLQQKSCYVYGRIFHFLTYSRHFYVSRVLKNVKSAQLKVLKFTIGKFYCVGDKCWIKTKWIIEATLHCALAWLITFGNVAFSA